MGALKGTRNRAHRKGIEPVEPDLFFLCVKYHKERNVMQPSVYFSVRISQI